MELGNNNHLPFLSCGCSHPLLVWKSFVNPLAVGPSSFQQMVGAAATSDVVPTLRLCGIDTERAPLVNRPKTIF